MGSLLAPKSRAISEQNGASEFNSENKSSSTGISVKVAVHGLCASVVAVALGSPEVDKSKTPDDPFSEKSKSLCVSLKRSSVKGMDLWDGGGGLNKGILETFGLSIVASAWSLLAGAVNC